MLEGQEEVNIIDHFCRYGGHSIISNSYYGMHRAQIHINLPAENPIISFETIEIKMALVSAKRSMAT